MKNVIYEFPSELSTVSLTEGRKPRQLLIAHKNHTFMAKQID